ncbi:alginate lyase family protein [Colwellia sp. E2M01]|uniref:alginate lyase family protein n=1 Tax=Colwellia sp. E2M01 TaxID=2841561 RepID=UPI001C08D870|nr:alginate lyase family protein [Colwellia sp. E2M01]MBU2871110.1 alginate lyase family protein [Colwellia sp. E2M01]
MSFLNKKINVIFSYLPTTFNLLITFLALQVFTTHAATPLKPVDESTRVSANKSIDFIQYSAESLANVKLSLQNGQAAKITQKAYELLLKKADSTLAMTNPSVMDKNFLPPSKNKHDYLSLSRYWWPDPKSADGLPWIRKDGVTNPDTQTDDVDRGRLSKTTSAIRILALAYYFSENEKYAQKGISLINTWFLDEKTKMNPHLQYAQSVPGNPNGRRSGMLDGRLIPERVLDSITIFSASPAWTNEKATQMNSWLNDYLAWLTTSKLGKTGATQKNNHGSWYRFQIAALSWYLGDKALFEKTIVATINSFSEQFNEQGAQEHELQRTRAFFYSCFNLQALALVANLAEKGDTPIWRYQSPKGHSLTLAVEYLMPVTRGEKWQHASKNLDPSQLSPILAGMVMYGNMPKYQTTLSKIMSNLGNKDNLTSHQKYKYYEFALLTPQLM